MDTGTIIVARNKKNKSLENFPDEYGFEYIFI